MAESLFIKADKVSVVLGISLPEAYRLTKRLNDGLAATGYIIINNIRASEVPFQS